MEPMQASRQSLRHSAVKSKIILQERMRQHAIRHETNPLRGPREPIKRITQAERLLEAARTEEENLAWLHRFDRLDEEKRRWVAGQKGKKKGGLHGPTVRWWSRLLPVKEGAMEVAREEDGDRVLVDGTGSVDLDVPTALLTQNLILFKPGTDDAYYALCQPPLRCKRERVMLWNVHVDLFSPFFWLL